MERRAAGMSVEHAWYAPPYNGVGCVTLVAIAAAAAARFCYSLEPSVGKQTVGTRVYGYVINVEAPRNRLDITAERERKRERIDGWIDRERERERMGLNRAPHTHRRITPVGDPSARFPRECIPGTSDEDHRLPGSGNTRADLTQ